jgi:hypothetical protein
MAKSVCVGLRWLRPAAFDYGKKLAANVFGLGEEADLKAHTFSLAQMPIESTNVQISTKPAFLPSVC